MIGFNSHPCGDDMIQTEAQCQSDSDTSANAYSRRSHRNPENMPARCAQSHANAELVGPLRYGVREDTVKSNPGRKESRDRKSRKQG